MNTRKNGFTAASRNKGMLLLFLAIFFTGLILSLFPISQDVFGEDSAAEDK